MFTRAEMLDLEARRWHRQGFRCLTAWVCAERDLRSGHGIGTEVAALGVRDLHWNLGVLVKTGKVQESSNR